MNDEIELELAGEASMIGTILVQFLNINTQAQGEAALAAYRTKRGFLPLLVFAAMDQNTPDHIRQAALIVAKSVIRDCWTSLAPVDKSQCLALAPRGLGDTTSKVRTAAAMLVDMMVSQEGMDTWIALFRGLIPAMLGENGPHWQLGALRAAHMVATGDALVNKETLPAVLPGLLSASFAVAASSNGGSAKALAFDMFKAAALWCALEKEHGWLCDAAMCGGEQSTLQGWWQVMFVELEQAAARGAAGGEAAGGDFACVCAVLDLMRQLLVRYRALLGEQGLAQCATAVVQTLGAVLDSYVQIAVVDGAVGSQQCDVDGNECGIEAMVVRLLEIASEMCLSKTASKHLASMLDQLAHCVVGYTAMSEDEMDLWERDPNEYAAADELDKFSVRLAATELGERMLGQFLAKAGGPVIQAATAWHARGVSLPAGSALGWKSREAAAFVMGLYSRTFVRWTHANLLQFDAVHYVEQTLISNVAGDHVVPLLAARSLWCASQFANDLNIERTLPFLHYCATAFSTPNTPPPVLVMASKAVWTFCVPLGNRRRGDAVHVAPLMPTLMSGVASMLAGATENTLTLLVDALGACARVHAETTADLAPTVLPHVLAAWTRSIKDDLTSRAVRDCVRSFSCVPRCVPVLTALLERPFATLFRPPPPNEAPEVEFLRQSLLDLLREVVHGFALPGQEGVVLRAGNSPLVDVTLPQVVQLALGARAHQHALLQNAAGALTAFARRVSPDNGGNVATMLLQCAARFLSAEIDDQGALFVGPFVGALVGGPLQAHVQPQLEQILGAIYTRLLDATMPTVIQGLLMVFAQMFRHSASAVAQWLETQPAKGRGPVPGLVSANGLHFVLGMWMQEHETLMGSFASKMSAGVLMQLANSPLGDVPVPGCEQEGATNGPRKSRRLAKAAPAWTSVPLRVKLIPLMAQNYRDALLEDLSMGVPDAVADEFEDNERAGDDDEDDDLLQALVMGMDGAGAVGEDEHDERLRMFDLLENLMDEPDDEDEDDLLGMTEESTDPDIIHDPLYNVPFTGLIEHYFGQLARQAPQLLGQAKNAGLLTAKLQRTIECAVQTSAQVQGQ